jgi:hypothetical protein
MSDCMMVNITRSNLFNAQLCIPENDGVSNNSDKYGSVNNYNLAELQPIF